MISAEIVAQTWMRTAKASERDGAKLVGQMADEQPAVLSYLTGLQDLPFNDCEHELVFYIGMVLWQIMKQSDMQLYEVTPGKLRMADESNSEFRGQLMLDNDGEFIGTAQSLTTEHPEPEVIRYIVEAIKESMPDEPGIRPINKSLAYIHLKILVDAFVSCLAPRPHLAA